MNTNEIISIFNKSIENQVNKRIEMNNNSQKRRTDKFTKVLNSNITDMNDNITQLLDDTHIHDNKAQLDLITTAFIEVLTKLTASGNIDAVAMVKKAHIDLMNMLIEKEVENAIAQTKQNTTDIYYILSLLQANNIYVEQDCYDEGGLDDLSYV